MGSSLAASANDVADTTFLVIDPFGRSNSVMVTTRAFPTGVQPRVYSLSSPSTPEPADARFLPGRLQMNVQRFWPRRSTFTPEDVGCFEGLDIVMSQDALQFDAGEEYTSAIRVGNFDQATRELYFPGLQFSAGQIAEVVQRGQVTLVSFETATIGCGSGGMDPCTTYVLLNASTRVVIRQFTLLTCTFANTQSYYAACDNSFVFLYKEPFASMCSILRVPVDNPTSSTNFTAVGAPSWDNIQCATTPPFEIYFLFASNGANAPTVAAFGQSGAARQQLGNGFSAAHLNTFDGQGWIVTTGNLSLVFYDGLGGLRSVRVCFFFFCFFLFPARFTV
jgi:hypothetical protein